MMFRKQSPLSSSIQSTVDSALKREILLAQNIQMSLLNGEKPQLASGEVTGSTIPARLIGGDYFDFYPLPDGKIRIVIGDVMGKGIPAAMLMILTRGAFRSASETTQSPGETLSAMNNALFADLRKLGSFVTVFCSDWDPETGKLTYASAGHNLPIIVRGSRALETARSATGVMIGGLPKQYYDNYEVRLQTNDLVFFYTDGIVEAQNRQGDIFRLNRLVQLLVETGQRDAEHIERHVIESIDRFTEGLPQKDDITMIILKVGECQSELTGYNAPILNA